MRRSCSALLTLLVPLVGVGTSPSSTHACNDIFVREEVVGVAKDGRIVITRESGPGGGDATYDAVEIRGTDGRVLTSVTWCAGSCVDYCRDLPAERASICRRETGALRIEGAEPPIAVGRHGARSYVRALSKQLGLAKPHTVASRLRVDGSEEGECSIRAGAGAPPLYFGYHECGATRAHVLGSSRSPLEMLVVVERHEAGGCARTTDEIVLFPRGRIASSKAYARAMSKRDSAARAKALAAVVRADPGLLDARVALARALSETDLPWEERKARLDIPFRADAPCWGGLAPEEYHDEGLFEDTPELQEWLAAHAAQHDAAHPPADDGRAR